MIRFVETSLNRPNLGIASGSSARTTSSTSQIKVSGTASDEESLGRNLSESESEEENDLTKNPNQGVNEGDHLLSVHVSQPNSVHNSQEDLNENQPNSVYNSQENLNLNQANMAQSPKDFLSVAGQIFNYKYNGDALKLESFLTDIELVVELAAENNADLCLKFVKSKLESRALECMPDEIADIRSITDALKATIKPENSKIVEGKIMALRLEKGNFT